MSKHKITIACSAFSVTNIKTSLSRMTTDTVAAMISEAAERITLRTFLFVVRLHSLAFVSILIAACKVDQKINMILKLFEQY